MNPCTADPNTSDRLFSAGRRPFASGLGIALVVALFHCRPNGLAFFIGKLSVSIGIEVFQNGLTPSLFHLFPLLRGWFALSLPVLLEPWRGSVVLELWTTTARTLLLGAMSWRPELRVSADGAALPMPLELVRPLTTLLLPLALAMWMGSCDYCACEKRRDDCCCFHLPTSCGLIPRFA